MSTRRAALLIGTSEYEDSSFRALRAPQHDVACLAEILRDGELGGFTDVQILLNESKDSILLAIEDFLDGGRKEDLLLLYFSCHGIKDEDGRLHYVAKNTRQKRLVASAIPAYVVNDLIAKSRSRRKILILDCCYSGACSNAYLAKAATTEAGVGAMEVFRQGQGLVTLTASDAFQFSFEEEDTGERAVNSVFTRALIEGVKSGKADRDGDQLISLDELYEYAYDHVQSVNPNQKPRIQGETEGRIVFARNPRPPEASRLPQELQEAIGSVFVGNREYAIGELGKLLRGKNKPLSLAAYDALVQFKADDSRKVASQAEALLKEFDQEREAQKEERATAVAAGAEVARVEAERVAQENAERERVEAEEAAAARREAERLAVAKAQPEIRGDGRGTMEQPAGSTLTLTSLEPSTFSGKRKAIIAACVTAAVLIGIGSRSCGKPDAQSDSAQQNTSAQPAADANRPVDHDNGTKPGKRTKKPDTDAQVAPALPVSDPRSAKLAGVVTDDTGALVPNAKVHLVLNGDGRTFDTNTSLTGTYSVGDLPAGTYKATASLPGFSSAERDITLKAGESLNWDVRFSVAGAPLKQVRVAGNVMNAKLLKRVSPQYPPLAQQARLQGVVRFTAIIGKDGAIHSLTLVSGHPLLSPAAEKAVRQWVYEPTLLNGSPVEVVTVIEVNFALSAGAPEAPRNLETRTQD